MIDHAALDGFDIGGIQNRRDGERHETVSWPRAHCRDVAQVHRGQPPPELATRKPPPFEVAALDQRIGGDDEILAGVQAQHRRVVTDPNYDAGRAATSTPDPARERIDELEFGFHDGLRLVQASTVYSTLCRPSAEFLLTYVSKLLAGGAGDINLVRPGLVLMGSFFGKLAGLEPDQSPQIYAQRVLDSPA